MYELPNANVKVFKIYNKEELKEQTLIQVFSEGKEYQWLI